MTSRERVSAALNHTEPDRTPVFEYVLLPPIADILLGRKAVSVHARWQEAAGEMGWEAAVRQTARDLVDLAMVLQHDMLFAPLPPGPAPPATVSDEPVDDPVERLRARNRRAAEAPEMPESRFLLYLCLKEEMVRRGLDLPVMASAAGHGIWTDTDLMEAMLLDPDVAREHFALATKRCLSLVRRYAETGCVDMVQVGGDFSGSRPLISPDAYRAFIVPEVRKVSQFVRANGMVPVNASDGNLWPVLNDFLFSCEVSGYCEIDWSAGMRIERLAEVCRGRVTLFGNLDCGTVLSFGSEDEVRHHVRRCLDAGKMCGHILCASNAITSSVPVRNYMAAVKTYRDYFCLPALRL